MVSGAILAGGRATRFGGIDKGSLVIEGRSILERQVEELSKLTGDILIVGGTSRHPRARTVADSVRDCGPLAGLQAALARSEGDRTIVIAGDMPYITAPLLAYFTDLADSADAVVPRTDRGWHPLCAVYTPRCLAPIAARLAARRLKVSDLLADLCIRAVPPEELGRFGNPEQLLVNLNTPGEYTAVTALHAHGR
jgi:molybdopterin-guanine dinucleotide biosynthesis protein A